MKSVFDWATRTEMIRRIDSLTPDNQAQWGKMNVHQMLKHCILCDEMFLGKKKYKRVLLGRLFGRLGLKNLLKDETPLKHGSPTGAAFKIKEAGGDIASEKKKWISLVEEYGNYSKHDFEHWFFGKMTKEQVGWFVYKHNDHHLRQFNA
jgi:hypothetical protein